MKYQYNRVLTWITAEMVEGHIEFALSVRMCVCSFVFQIQAQPITLSCIMGYEKYLAEIIIVKVMCSVKEHFVSSKVSLS